MNFIETYGCKKNEGLEDLGYLSSRDEVFRFEENTPLEQCYDDVIDFAVELGLENGFVQEGESASESFIPPFNLEGV